MSLELMYITNNPDVAYIAQKYGVDRIWIDMEYKGKDDRQKGLDSVKNHHTIEDIKRLRPIVTTSKLMVRINPWDEESNQEIEDTINAGADIIMLAMWKSAKEVQEFANAVDGRCKTVLLLEIKEAVECIDDVLKIKGIDEIHIGLNDLHLELHMKFMFELLANGTVEKICNKIKLAGIPYGFGGIARVGEGTLPAEAIIAEHYRLGSTCAILSRSFCNTSLITDVDEIKELFNTGVKDIRDYEKSLINKDKKFYLNNQEFVKEKVDQIVKSIELNVRNVKER